MQQLMTKESLDKFLNKEFPQVSKNFKILNVSDQSFSMLMYITEEHLRPGATVSGPTMFLLADVTFYLATLSVGDVLIYSEDIDEPVAHASLKYSIPQK